MELSDRDIAYKILSLLCESSLANELTYYRKEIQNDLVLSDQTMDRLYNLKALCKALEPIPPVQRFYRGRLLASESCSCSLGQYGWRCWHCSNSILRNSVDLRTIINSPIQEVAQPVQEVAQPVHESTQEASISKEDLKAEETLKELFAKNDLVLEGVTIINAKRYEKLVVVTGLSKENKEKVSAIGGKWNNRLNGWVFSKTKLISN